MKDDNMNEQDRETWRTLFNLVGRRLRGLARIHFCYGNQCDREDGPLEISFHDGVTVIMKSGGGGDFLVVEQEPWRDVLNGWSAEAISKHISEVGAYRRFDVTREAGYVGSGAEKLVGVLPIESKFGRLIGAEMLFGCTVVTMYCAADEEYVVIGKCRERLRRMGARVAEQLGTAGDTGG